ncbi:hypothetical protein ACHAQJ_003966, partial [Trichoderma viride]
MVTTRICNCGQGSIDRCNDVGVPMNQQPLTAHDAPTLGLLNPPNAFATLAKAFGLPSWDPWFCETISSDCRSCWQELGRPDEKPG